MGDNEIIQCSIRDITDRIRAQEREDTLHSLLRHDVANKNRVVEGYLELLEEYDFDENIGKLIKNSKRAIVKSLKLIEKVRILRQAQNEKIEEVDISSMIKNTVNDMRPRIEEAGMELKMECPENECIVKAGPLLSNVFSNLIENAVKHSDGSKLGVNVKTNKNKVICTFEDDGKGIPDEDKTNVFEKGYTTDEERGTGLGLFLSKMLLDIYDAEIKVIDSELGGTRFDVHLEKT